MGLIKPKDYLPGCYYSSYHNSYHNPGWNGQQGYTYQQSTYKDWQNTRNWGEAVETNRDEDVDYGTGDPHDITHVTGLSGDDEEEDEDELGFWMLPFGF